MIIETKTTTTKAITATMTIVMPNKANRLISTFMIAFLHILLNENYFSYAFLIE